MILAALLLLMTFVFPIWRVTLIAPQYPDGVTMYIWINKITGDTPGTLQNINILNHYVGMKPIDQEAIPELKYFPFIIVGLTFLGLLAAWVGRRPYILAWVLLLALAGVLGMYDFYLWEYDYGHNLDPTAPIKVPGMSYQPPLFGVKLLLNFIAESYPHWGSLFIGLAMGLAGWAWAITTKRSKS